MPAVPGLTSVTSIASHTATNAWAVAGDFFIIFALFMILFGFAWYLGRGPFVGLLLALYGAYAVYIVFPYQALLPTAPALTALLSHVGLYLAFVIVFFMILRRVVVSDFLYIGPFGLITLAFLGATLIMVFSYQVFPLADLYHFSPAVAAIFEPKQYFFYWFVAPLVGLFFLAR